LPVITPSNAQLDVWVTSPTYSDSPPFFKVEFAPGKWQLNTENPGYPVLQHTMLQGCSISPAVGHGLPPDLSVERTSRKIGNCTYELNIVRGEQVLSINYCTHNVEADVSTCFELGLSDDQQSCIQDAEAVLATLALFE
jgi:hypothetical protein